MYICNYCKRNFKKKHETCPVCGGTNFSEKAYLGEEIIKIPPEGGYKINMDNFEKKKKRNKTFTIIGIIVTIGLLVFDFPFFFMAILMLFTAESEMIFSTDGLISILTLIIPLLIPFIALIITIIIRYKSNKSLKSDLKRLNELATKGILVKGLPYELINDGSHIMGKPFNYMIKVYYENSNGVKIPLISDIKYDAADRNDETVDLLIDPNDYANYYIDYEIY